MKNIFFSGPASLEFCESLAHGQFSRFGELYNRNTGMSLNMIELFSAPDELGLGRRILETQESPKVT